jgi:tetratricopeptide (TPR) repeat protein
MRRPGLSGAVALALPAAVFAAYWPALRGGFIWDDDAHVTQTGLRSLHGLWRIWSEPGATQQYYPVLHSAFWLEHRLWGDSALGYHLLNVALHLLASLLLFRVLRRLSVPGALLAVSAFALHPVCVETVAWISEQKNTLSTVFYMAAALAYLRFDSQRRWGWYALGAALFGMALLSKSVTATLPAAILVVIWWKRGRVSLRSDVLALAPWFCMSAAAGYMTSWMERTYIGANGAAFQLGLAERFLVAGRVAWFYLGKVLWPADLVFIYPRWSVDAHAAWQYLFPASALAVLATLYALRGRSRGPLASALLFVGTLFPALGFVNVYPFVFSYVADHFQYLAAAGLISSLSAAAALAWDRPAPGGRVAARAAAAGLVALLAGLTWAQSGRYGDLQTFYEWILARNPASWLAHDNLGVVLVGRGRIEEAAGHYREAMRLNPGYPEAFNNYGNVMAKARRWDEAEGAYAGALRARPWFFAAEFNWGTAMSDAGRYREAETHFNRALRLKPDYAQAHYGLANAMANMGRLPAAAAEYKEALRLLPEFPEAHANLGLALAEQGQWEQGLQQIEEAIRGRPGYAEARAYHGFALVGSGRLTEAVSEYREALRLGVNNADIHYQIGVALGKLGRLDEANVEFAEARRLEGHP